MAKLPTPGGDAGQWGNILNEYLSVEHNPDGTHKFKSGRPFYDVRAFGPLDTPSNATATIQAAMNALASTGGILYFPQGTDYVINKSIILPSTVVPGASFTRFDIIGYGARISTSTPDVTVFKDAVEGLDIEDITKRMGRQISIRGFTFRGSALAGQRGISLVGTYNAHIVDCTFEHFDTSLDLQFCLMARVENCLSHVALTYGFVARSCVGVVPGATHSNSASNHTSFVACRDYARYGMTAQFYILGSNGVNLTQCITEGGTKTIFMDGQYYVLGGQYGVLFDGASNTTAKSFMVTQHHHETTVMGKENSALDSACFRIANQSGGHVIIDEVYSNTLQVMVDTSGCGSTLVVYVRIPYLPGPGPWFKADPHGAKWDVNGTANMLAEGTWVNKIIPAYLRSRRFTGTEEAQGGAYPMDEMGLYYLRAGTFRHVSGRSSPQISSYMAAAPAFGAWTAPAHPATLNNGEWYAWRDEANNKLKIVVKYSDGTIKTGEINLF
jgi:hypothetical protein